MNKSANKGLVVALLFYAGAFLCFYIANLPPQLDEFVVPEELPHPMLRHTSLVILLFAISCTIASVKLRRR